MVEEDCHDLAKLFVKDIRKYIEMGGDIKFMTFDNVYRLIDPKKEFRKEEPPTYSKLRVRGDRKDEPRI